MFGLEASEPAKKSLKIFQENNNESVRFVSINSINWTRIMAQSVYFFYTK